jgi:hypothetical protein
VLRLPAEQLTTVFEQLPAHDAAAATRVCRNWARVGVPVLWRSPPERVLRELSTGARYAHGAFFVAELRLSSRSVGRILAAPWPRLTSLYVSLTAILAHQHRFCRFVREHGCSEVTSLDGNLGVAMSSSGSSYISGADASGFQEATHAAARTRLLTSVRIGKVAR